MFRPYRSLSILTFVALVAVWAGPGGNSAERSPAPGTEHRLNGPADASAEGSLVPGTEFHQKLHEIAVEYLSWGRVDDETRWAPKLCEPDFTAKIKGLEPAAGQPEPTPSAPPVQVPHAQFSKSKDEATHGRKLYSLFASEQEVYLAGDRQPVGQVIVKQSWTPEEVRADDPRLTIESPRITGADKFIRTVSKGGKLYLAAKQADLFIMFKTDPKTPNTDEGWVYGTVTPDGKTVTSAGRVESCMACHKDAKADRLFGIKCKTE